MASPLRNPKPHEHRCTDNLLKALCAVFTFFRNDSGTLGYGEVEGLVREMGLDLTQVDMACLWKLLDVDGDGVAVLDKLHKIETSNAPPYCKDVARRASVVRSNKMPGPHNRKASVSQDHIDCGAHRIRSETHDTQDRQASIAHDRVSPQNEGPNGGGARCHEREDRNCEGHSLPDGRSSRTQGRACPASLDRRGSVALERLASLSRNRRRSLAGVRQGSVTQDRRASLSAKCGGSERQDRLGSLSTNRRDSLSPDRRGSLSTTCRGSEPQNRWGSISQASRLPRNASAEALRDQMASGLPSRRESSTQDIQANRASGTPHRWVSSIEDVRSPPLQDRRGSLVQTRRSSEAQARKASLDRRSSTIWNRKTLWDLESSKSLELSASTSSLQSSGTMELSASTSSLQSSGRMSRRSSVTCATSSVILDLGRPASRASFSVPMPAGLKNAPSFDGALPEGHSTKNVDTPNPAHPHNWSDCRMSSDPPPAPSNRRTSTVRSRLPAGKLADLEREFERWDANGNGVLEQAEVLTYCQDYFGIFSVAPGLNRVYDRICAAFGVHKGEPISMVMWKHKAGPRVVRTAVCHILGKQTLHSGTLSMNLWYCIIQWVPDLHTLAACGWVSKTFRRVSSHDPFWFTMLRRERRKQVQPLDGQSRGLPAMDVTSGFRDWFMVWKRSAWLKARQMEDDCCRPHYRYDSTHLSQRCQALLMSTVQLPTQAQAKHFAVVGDGKGTLTFRDLHQCLDHPDFQASKHDGAITCLAQSDTLLLTGSADCLCHVWDKTDFRFPVYTLQGHRDRITAIAVSADQLWVVTGGNDRSLFTWNLETTAPSDAVLPDCAEACNIMVYKCLPYCKSLKGHTMKITNIVLTECSIFSASTDSHVKVWDWQGTCKFTITEHLGPVHFIRLYEGHLLSFCGGGMMRVTDAESFTTFEAVRIHRAPISCVLFHGDVFFVGANDGCLSAYRAGTRHHIAVMEGHSRWVRCLAMVTSNRLVSACDGKTVAVWDTSPLLSARDSLDRVHLRPLYFLAGPKAAISALQPHFLEDGTPHGILAASADYGLHYWEAK